MDNKKKMWAAAIAAVVLGLSYLYIFAPDVELLKKIGSRKTMEASSITVRGREKGRPSFEISAGKASTDKDQSVVDIENVTSGKVFAEDGSITLKELKATWASVQQYSNIIEARGNPLTARVDIGAASGKAGKDKGFSLLRAESFRYNTSTKKGSIHKGSLSGKKFEIKGDTIEVDTRAETALFYPNPLAKTPSQTIRAATLESFFGRDALKGYGNASVELKKDKTTVQADLLEFSTDNYSGSMEGNVRFSQKGKFSTASRMDYDDEAGTAVLHGSVKTMIERGSAVLNESTIEKIRSAETRKMLKDGMLLNCESLTVFIGSGNASAEGKVELLQKRNRARSDRAYFDKAKENVTMTGNVFIEKQGQWLKTQKVVASLSKEDFEATGGVETLIRIKRSR